MQIARAKAESPQLALAEQLALYVRLGFAYPETNVRVVQAATELASLVREIGSTVILRFDGRGTNVFVGETKILVSGHHVPWLRECMARTLLSGVSIPAGARTSHFWEFAVRLRENQHRAVRGATFEALWPTGETHDPLRLTPIELRFGHGEIATSGDQDGAGLPLAGVETISPPEQRRLVRLLSTSPKIGDLLTDLHATPTSDEATASLLDEIVRILPADIAHDPERMHQVVTDTLVRLRAALANEDGSPIGVEPRPMTDASDLRQRADRKGFGSVANNPAFPVESGDLRTMIHALALRFFRAGPNQLSPQEPATMPRGHEGDELVRDDVEALEHEFQTLPRRDVREEELGRDSTVELLGIVLHSLATSPQGNLQARLRSRLRRLLSESDPRLRELVVAYLAPLFDPALQSDREAIAEAERVLEAVRLAELLPILRGTSLLDLDHVVAAFPRTFILFLDSIPAGDPDALAIVPAVCARVGTHRLAAARSELFGEHGLGTPERITRLLATPSSEVLPLLPALLGPGSGDLLSSRLESIIHFVRRCALSPRDTAVIRIVPVNRIPLRYVVDYCAEAGRLRGRLVDQSAALLRDFVSTTRGDAEEATRRLSAIRALGDFDSPATRTFLEQLRAGRFGPLKLRRESKAVRDAAHAALASLDGLARESEKTTSVSAPERSEDARGLDRPETEEGAKTAVTERNEGSVDSKKAA